jgi:drug/metabolite transporter (DMT)-like permease
MNLKDALLCAAVAVAMPTGQAMFKFAAITDAQKGLGTGASAANFIVRVLTNWPLMAAFAWYGLTALLWFYVLTRVPLSQAYAFSLVGSALVPIIAWAVFKEPVSWRIAVGYVLMLSGLFFVLQAQARP